jgi:ribonuclease R
MLDKVGEEFAGIITSVTSFGIFVELEEIYVDGLVHITALDNDYYHFDPVGHRLTGERSGHVYRLGDQVEIKVAAVNLDDRKIDFVLSDSDSGTGRSSKTKGKRKAARRRAMSQAIDEIMDKPQVDKETKKDKKRKSKKVADKEKKSSKRRTAKRKKQRPKK